MSENDVPLHEMSLRSAQRQAVDLSIVEKMAYVYRLRTGRIIATTTVDRHMVPGVLLETYHSGKRLTL